MNDSNELQKSVRTTQIIGYAMLAGVVSYAAIVYVVPRDGAPAVSADMSNLLRYIFWGISLAGFAAIPVIQKLIANKTVPGTEGASAASSVLQRKVASAIVVFAICESTALYGIVLFFLTRNQNDFYFLALLALAGILSNLPNPRRWEDEIGVSPEGRSSETGG